MYSIYNDFMESEEISLTPPEYRIAMLENTKNTVLARSDALRMRGYGNWNFDKRIEVYCEERLPEPFVCEVVQDIHKIDFTIVHGIPVCTERQAFTDLINDPRGDTQTLLEALGDYYYTHNKSFSALKLDEDTEKKLRNYTEDAIHYWTY